MGELSANVHGLIQDLCAQGDSLAADGKFTEAIAQYNKAWELVPQPRQDWNASTWILAAIGDVCFRSSHYTSGIEALEFAMQCPDGLGNPFLHLRLGQCYFEKGELDAAADQLARAYMADGEDIFAREDGKYFDLLKARLEPPVSGAW